MGEKLFMDATNWLETLFIMWCLIKSIVTEWCASKKIFPPHQYREIWFAHAGSNKLILTSLTQLIQWNLSLFLILRWRSYLLCHWEEQTEGLTEAFYFLFLSFFLLPCAVVIIILQEAAICGSVRKCYSDYWWSKDINGLTQIWTLWSTVINYQARCAYRGNNWVSISRITNWYLIRYNTFSIKKNSSLIL